MTDQTNRPARRWRLLGAVTAAVAAVSGSFAVAGFSESFVGEPASSAVTDAVPGAVVTAVLETLGPLAQPASFALALAVLLALLTAVVLLAFSIAGALSRRYLAAPLTALSIWLVAAATTGAPVEAVGAALPAAAVVAFLPGSAFASPAAAANRTPDRTKRATLQAGFAALSFAGASAILGSRRTPETREAYLDGGTEAPERERQLLESAAAASFDLPEAPGLVSRIGEFYTVDIDTIDPNVDAADWTLSVTGSVDEGQTLTYDDLRELPAERFHSTLRCVGEGRNDREMDAAVWTGVPVTEVLEAVAIDPDADVVVAHAADGFWNVITRAELERSYLVYGMNGRVLPRQHGHPVRLLVPGNWGEVNVKWLEEIEFATTEREGYWQERGWEGTGEAETVAKLWSVDRGPEGVTVGGHAYAGRRGVDRVEVSIDGGETWTDADLSPALEGPETAPRDTWRQWRYAFDPDGIAREVVVRAVDGDGTVQSSTESDPVPDGATGWVSRTIEP